MRLLYLAPLPIDFNNLDGVQKKILCQIATFNKYFDVDLLYYFDGFVLLKNMKINKISKICRARNKVSVLMAACKKLDLTSYDATYIRYPLSDFIFLSMLKKFKNHKITTIVEIPTFPYDKEGFESIRGVVKNIFDRTCRKYIKKYVDRIVTFSDDSTIFGVKTINTINGINFDEIKYDESSIDVNNRIEVIAVSSMYRVHGYERLIEGLNNYYSNGGNRKIVLKLVGKGDECVKYQKLIEKYGLQENVKLCGACFGIELENLYKGNAIGVNSLAIHRQNLVNESTLKTKEYAAKGLPIISSSFVDAFDEEGNNKFVLRIPPDESAVDIDSLVKFIDGIYRDKDISQVRHKIRENGKGVCDIEITMKPIITYILSGDGNQ